MGPAGLPTVGMIGLGNLGRPMALSLLASGHPLVVTSLARHEADDMVVRGATWADSAADVAAQVDVLITVLPGPVQVRDTMIGSGGALARMRREGTFIDMSTSSADVAHELMDAAGPLGVSVMEAPVSFVAMAPIGSSRASASLQIFVGGTRDDFERHLPLFRALGGIPEQIVHAGPNGAGYAIKVLLNVLWFIHAAGTAEVLAVASRLGVDLRVVQRALCDSPAQSNFLQYDVNSVFERGDYDDGFTMDLVCKDIQLAVGLGEQAGIDVQVSRLVEQIHRRALDAYGPKSGEMSVFKLYEDASGTAWRLPPA
ncbi:MAG: NAD(P)-dependent oxidoreductase [Acidobacteria bacterium]|nr:NAD(P)-dependent oxidoreductase [Acidobacteriota bacterium]